MRDSQVSKNSALQRGFTLLELMVTIMVLAVIFGLAVPSFASFTATQRVRSASFDLNASLVQARAEATKRNVDVVIQQASGGWQNGWTVTAGGTQIAQHDALANIAIDSGGQTSITIQGNGRQPVGAGTVKFIFSSSPSASGVTNRCLMVDSSGKATTAC